MNTKDIIRNKPIVHCITNIVTVNDCANILLAIGASPTMAHHVKEVAEIQKGCNALVCNLGATENYEAMLEAVIAAKEAKHPVIIDPVGCGGSSYRREFFKKLVKICKPDCIRGNYAEITALARDAATVTGVDDTEKNKLDAVDIDLKLSRIDEVEREAIKLSQMTGAVVIASGEVDIIVKCEDSDGNSTLEKMKKCGQCYLNRVEGGDEMMSRITGSGCMLSSMLGAYMAVENSFESAVRCCEDMKGAGKKAAQLTAACGGGTMTFREKLIDSMFFE